MLVGDIVLTDMSLSDLDRGAAKAKALSLFQVEQFDYVRCVAEGRFSSIVAIKTPLKNHLVAAKIIAAKYVDPGKLDLWRDLPFHKNIVPLLRIMGDEALHILLTPLYITSLKLILRKKVRAQPECFQWTKNWIRDVTEGLSHLHLQGVCHLNLEPSNIFIGSNRIAAIGDFDCIQSTTRPTNTFGPLSQYSPPECWSDSSENDRPCIEGIPHDLWSLGMVALHVWANHPLDTKLWDRKDWNDLFPSIFEALQIESFKKKVTRAFPNSNINDVEVLSCLNFLRGLLHTDPMKRPITSRVLEHQVLQGGIWQRLDTWFVGDPAWESLSNRERGRGDNIVHGKSGESTQIDASGDCEESRSTTGSNLTSEASPHGAHGDGEESLPTRASIEVTPDSPEEGVSRRASNRRARVRGWLRRRWKRVKAFFCCETSTD